MKTPLQTDISIQGDPRWRTNIRHREGNALYRAGLHHYALPGKTSGAAAASLRRFYPQRNLSHPTPRRGRRRRWLMRCMLPAGRLAATSGPPANCILLDRTNEPATCIIRGLQLERRPIHIRRCRLMNQNSAVVGLDVHKGRQAHTAQEGRWCLIGLGRKLDLWSR
jgi:hypothetical protein